MARKRRKWKSFRKYIRGHIGSRYPSRRKSTSCWNYKRFTSPLHQRYINITSQPLYDKHTLAGNGILLLPNADAHSRPYCIRFPLVYFILSHFFIALMYIVLHLVYITILHFPLSPFCSLYHPLCSYQRNISYIFFLTSLYAPLSCLPYN